jgi:hypothetical protein
LIVFDSEEEKKNENKVDKISQRNSIKYYVKRDPYDNLPAALRAKTKSIRL